MRFRIYALVHTNFELYLFERDFREIKSTVSPKLGVEPFVVNETEDSL